VIEAGAEESGAGESSGSRPDDVPSHAPADRGKTVRSTEPTIAPVMVWWC